MVNMITVDDSGVVTAVSVGGYIQGGIEVGYIPAEVIASADCRMWKYSDEDGFTINDDYDKEHEV
mgnify:CR=1 FL=1